MTFNVTATTDIHATAEAVLQFVLDLDAYRKADHKITRVASVTGPDESGKGSARVWGEVQRLADILDNHP